MGFAATVWADRPGDGCNAMSDRWLHSNRKSSKSHLFHPSFALAVARSVAQHRTHIELQIAPVTSGKLRRMQNPCRVYLHSERWCNLQARESGEHEAKRIGSINPVIVKIPFFTLQLQCWQLRWCSKRANNFARIDFLLPIEGKKTLLLLIWMSSSSSIWRIESSTLYLHFIYDVAHQQRWWGKNISVNSCRWRRAPYTHNFYRKKSQFEWFIKFKNASFRCL